MVKAKIHSLTKLMHIQPGGQHNSVIECMTRDTQTMHYTDETHTKVTMWQSHCPYIIHIIEIMFNLNVFEATGDTVHNECVLLF